MLRAYTFVDRAVAAKLIGGHERPLLIIGAGVAGAMAAMRALEHEVRTVLVEKKDLFQRLATARKRYVSPTQYDWPAHHWTQASFPWRAPAMPLVWDSGLAARVLSGWRVILTEADRDEADFDLLKDTTLKGVKIRPEGSEYPERHMLEAHLTPQPSHVPRRFGAALSTIGFGKENCQAGSYVGYEFWGNDAFKRKNVGVRSGTPAVLISGGGDGALQDFLRIVTKVNSAHEIYQNIPAGLKPLIEREISYAEDCAVRAYVWSGAPHRDCALLQNLHDAHANVVGALKADASAWGAVRAGLAPILKNVPGDLTIKLAFPCTHFSSCYALNRFLTLLLAELLAETPGAEPLLLPETKTVEVSGSSHTCGEPDVCHGKQHEVVYVPSPICKDFADAERLYRDAGHSTFPRLPGGPFNVVIIRHGILSPVPLFNRSPTSNGRQALPYYIPW